MKRVQMVTDKNCKGALNIQSVISEYVDYAIPWVLNESPDTRNVSFPKT